jgi:hypothetical protein
LRLKTPLSPEFLKKLNGEFQDILFKGKIEPTGPFENPRVPYTTPNFSPF